MNDSSNNFPGPHFRNLFESAPNPYLVLDRDLKIVAVNDCYLNATLTKRSEILGRGIFDVFPDNPDDLEATGVGNLRASLERVLQSNAADAMAVQKYDIPSPEGGFEEKFWSPLNTPVFDDQGKLSYIIHRVEDVTEFIKLKQKGTEQHKLTEELKSRTEQMEGEIFQRAQQVQEANKKLREAERVKSEFFANVSHELRTPLSLILGPLESILSGKQGNLNEAQANYLKTIHNNTIRLLQMVNGILDFSKVEAGKMSVQREPTDISVLINSVLNDFESMLSGKKVALSSDINPSGKYVIIDHYLFERILFNLLSNAAKFTPEGGKVFVRMWTNDDKLYLSVTDTGIGIAESDLPRLFQKFRQAEGSSTRRFSGTGLGLAMVKEFAELLGGSVSVESKLNVGSTFTIECIAPSTNTPEVLMEHRSSRTALVPQYQNSFKIESQTNGVQKSEIMKVLICEDNEELSEYISSLLHDWCQIRRAKDGEEALQLVQAWSPDLVLTDFMMPKKDGIAVCTAIKNNPETSNIIVILLTALTHRDAMMKGWEAKADEYLFKPFHPEELVTRVKSFFSILSERKKAAEIIERKNRQLEYSNKELEAFSYSVSHDLRAPLRSIDGYTRVLQEDHEKDLGEEGRKVLNTILANTKKMGQLIDDLLAFSHLSRRELTRVSIDMNSLVNGVIDDLTATKNENRSVEFRVEPLADMKGDISMIKQVLINLISNAIKYSSKKEKAIINIESTTEGGSVIYSIKDNGVGFDMNYYNKLFGVFQRLHRPTEFEGTGVGLAIVDRIVSKHNGKVWAQGKPNEGATFFFSMPDDFAIHGENHKPHKVSS